MCKIDKPPSLSIKTLKNMTPEKMENEIFLFKLEILATNIDLSEILKNISQQLLSLNNVLKKFSFRTKQIHHGGLRVFFLFLFIGA